MRAKYYNIVLNPNGEIASFTTTAVVKPLEEFCKPAITSDSRGVTSIGVYVDESLGLPRFLIELDEFVKSLS